LDKKRHRIFEFSYVNFLSVLGFLESLGHSLYLNMKTESGFETRENFDTEMHKYPKRNSPMTVANHNPQIILREISK